MSVFTCGETTSYLSAGRGTVVHPTFCLHLYESSCICTLKVYQTSTNLYQNEFITKIELIQRKTTLQATLNDIYQLYIMQKVQKSTFSLQSSLLITSSSKISRLFCMLCLLSPLCQMSHVLPEPQQGFSEKHFAVLSIITPHLPHKWFDWLTWKFLFSQILAFKHKTEKTFVWISHWVSF